VREANGHYVLSPAPAGTIASGIERTFDLIGWGARRYLIPPEKIEEWRNAILKGEEPREGPRGRFYVRSPVAPVAGLPDAPASWMNDLRQNLLIGRVLEVSAIGLAKIGRARVDLGAEQGVREGDFLTVQRRGDARHRLFRVVSVDSGSCLADECYPASSGPLAEVGQTVVAAKNQ
jgi:hypothetical protein